MLTGMQCRGVKRAQGSSIDVILYKEYIFIEVCYTIYQPFLLK